MSKTEFGELQDQKLKKIIPHILNTPFYNRKLSGFTTKHLQNCCIANLQNFPLTHKSELRSTSPMVRTPLDVKDLLAFFSSSGTTGQPSVYAWSWEDQHKYEEISTRLLHNIGVGPGDVALLPLRMGTSLAWYAIFSEMRAIGATVVSLGPASLEEITKALIDYPITILKTSPVVASRLFRYIAETDISLLSKIHLRQIHLAGYFSSNARRRRLEEQWGVECYDMYGISEIGLVSGECSERKGQHFAADYILAEILSPENQHQVQDGQTGVAVYTPLWNKGAPLLRYWSNDFITMNYAPCRCNLNLPRLTFRGRDIDSAVLNRQRIFASDVENILLGHRGIGDEFLVEIGGNKYQFWIRVQIEVVGQVPFENLKEQLRDMFHAPVEIQKLPPNTLEQTSSKPIRIIDSRKLT